MSDDAAKKIQNMFDEISTGYDTFNRVTSFKQDSRWRKRCIKALGVAKGDKVLDLACGTGDMILTIQKIQPESWVVGADFSMEMLKLASKKVSSPLVAADATQLPFADKNFDKITIAFGFRNFVDKEKSLTEMRRVLKDGGKICILELSRPKSKLFTKIYWFYFSVVMVHIGNLIAKQKKAFRYLPESVDRMPRGDEYVNMVENAGFKDVQLKPYFFGVCNAVIAVKKD